MTLQNCKICGKANASPILFEYDCSNCGKYNITPFEMGSDASNEFNNLLSNSGELIKKNIHNIRGFLKEHEIFTITKENLINLINLRDLKPIDKLKKLLLCFYKQTDIGEILSIELAGDIITSKGHNLAPIIWAKTTKEVWFLIDELVNLNYMTIIGNPRADSRKIRITTKGFEYIDEIENTGTSEIGFCAMWFDNSMIDAWDNAIYPAIRDSGYLPQRIDIFDHNNVILEEIEGLIRQSKFLVVDVSGHRGGVYFEAGFAKALNKIIIYTCEEKHFEKIHFDIKHFNCLKWKKDDIRNFKEKLQIRIENTLGKGNYSK